MPATIIFVSTTTVIIRCPNFANCPIDFATYICGRLVRGSLTCLLDNLPTFLEGLLLFDFREFRRRNQLGHEYTVEN